MKPTDVPEGAIKEFSNLLPLDIRPPIGEEENIGRLPALSGLDGDGHRVIKSYWMPTAEELELLAEGGYIELDVLASHMVPVALNVVSYPDEPAIESARYHSADGPTHADDPKRRIWYGICTYWTDDWSKVAGNGVPHCPSCGSPGFESTAEEWEAGIERFESEGNEGYKEFLDGFKQRCLGRGPTVAKLWRKGARWNGSTLAGAADA